MTPSSNPTPREQAAQIMQCVAFAEAQPWCSTEGAIGLKDMPAPDRRTAGASPPPQALAPRVWGHCSCIAYQSLRLPALSRRQRRLTRCCLPSRWEVRRLSASDAACMAPHTSHTCMHAGKGGKGRGHRQGQAGREGGIWIGKLVRQATVKRQT